MTVTRKINDCPELQLVPSYVGDSGQLLLYFFIYGKQMRTLPTLMIRTNNSRREILLPFKIILRKILFNVDLSKKSLGMF
jgi:hypothetical protein